MTQFCPSLYKWSTRRKGADILGVSYTRTSPGRPTPLQLPKESAGMSDKNCTEKN